ncbi:MAG: type II secretion system protein GspN [Desulfobacteraceae bacterium]
MNVKTVFLYCLYTCFAFTFLAYLLFPGQEAARIVSRAVGDKLSWVNVSVDSIEPVLSGGFKVDQPEITMKNDIKVPVESVVIYPEITTLFKKRISAGFQIEAWEGVIKGRLTVGPGKHVSRITGDFSDLKIKDLDLHFPGTDLLVDFQAGGNWKYARLPEQNPQGSGAVQLTQLKAKVNNPLLDQLGINGFFFDFVDIQCEMNKNTLSVEQFTGSGAEFKKISLKGNVVMQNTLKTSRLNLKGELTPDPSLISNLAGLSSMEMLFDGSKRGIPFTITGTPENPRLRL